MELSRIIDEVESASTIDDEQELHAWYEHLYHHLNTSWHMRLKDKEFSETETEFRANQLFPVEDFPNLVDGIGSDASDN